MLGITLGDAVAIVGVATTVSAAVLAWWTAGRNKSSTAALSRLPTAEELLQANTSATLKLAAAMRLETKARMKETESNNRIATAVEHLAQLVGKHFMIQELMSTMRQGETVDQNILARIARDQQQD